MSPITACSSVHVNSFTSGSQQLQCPKQAARLPLHPPEGTVPKASDFLFRGPLSACLPTGASGRCSGSRWEQERGSYLALPAHSFLHSFTPTAERRMRCRDAGGLRRGGMRRQSEQSPPCRSSSQRRGHAERPHGGSELVKPC